jgi:hypothetical protein
MADFRAIVEAHGGQVYPWSQNVILAQKLMDPTGVCGACALIWIKCQKKGTSFLQAVKGDEGKREFLYIARLIMTEKRTLLNPGHSPLEFPNYPAAYLGDAGLKHQYERQVAVGPRDELSINTVVKLVTVPGFYYIIISNSASAHALAVNMYYNRFFEPNEGAATFTSSANMGTALAQWLRSEYPNMQGAGWVSKFA